MPNRSVSPLCASLTAAAICWSMRATAVSSRRISRIRSTARTRRVRTGLAEARMWRSSVAARSAERVAGTWPGASSASKSCKRLRVWVREATSSSRRSDNSRRVVAWPSTTACWSSPVPQAASAVLTASAWSVLRPCPLESSRTRAEGLAGTSTTCAPSLSSPLSQCVTQAGGVLDRPQAVRPPRRPAAQLSIAGPVGRDAQMRERLTPKAQHGRRMAGLVGIDPDDDRCGCRILGHVPLNHGASPRPGWTRGGQPDFGRSRPLLSHASGG